MFRRILVLSVVLFVPAILSAALTISFDGRQVRATDVQPGAQVVYFAIGLVPNGYESDLVRWQSVVTDEDHDRIVIFDAGRDVPCKSIWVVADLTNGELATAAPPGCPLRTSSLAAQPFKRSRGVIDTFFNRSPHLELLYVDSGKGAWVLSGTDGDSQDVDPDGITNVSLANATPLGAATGTPSEFKPGNVLVAIDFYRLEVAALRITGSMLNGVQ